MCWASLPACTNVEAPKDRSSAFQLKIDIGIGCERVRWNTFKLDSIMEGIGYAGLLKYM
jgi:hypothetical protein